MKKKVIWALLVTLATGAFVWAAGSASAVTPPKVCGGQNTNWTAPFACHADKTIDGVPVHVNVGVDASGNFAVEYIVPAQTQVATVQVIAHAGVSSTGPGSAFGGTIPAGATSTRIVGRFPDVCSDMNQLDIKWWLGTHDVNSHWPPDKRVSGPTFAVFKQACVAPTTTTVAPTTTVAGTTTTVAGQTTTTQATVLGATTAATLPPTGQANDVPLTDQLALAFIVLVLGGMLVAAAVVLTKRRQA